jgi:hypothetical protein
VLYALRYVGNDLPPLLRAKENSPPRFRGERFLIKPVAFGGPNLGQTDNFVVVSRGLLILLEDQLFEL